MKLSKNFTLKELIHTNTGIDNIPSAEQVDRLLYLTTYLLQPTRNEWGPLVVSSGYRSEGVNSRIKGSKTSQHMEGEAADIIPRKTIAWEVYKWIIEESGLQFGQCIFEHVESKFWIHISLPRIGKTNQQALIYDGKSYKEYNQ